MENKQEQEQKAKELAAKRAKYPVLDGGVTDEMRQSWKQANGRVVTVDVLTTWPRNTMSLISVVQRWM